MFTPVARDQTLTTDQVFHMTSRAMDLIGGMGCVVADTARLVVIKPNISIARASGTGIISDARVVRAVALLVHEAAPQARILIAEGAGGWVSPSLADCSLVNIRSGADRAEVLQDGFEIAGHRATVTELQGMASISTCTISISISPISCRCRAAAFCGTNTNWRPASSTPMRGSMSPSPRPTVPRSPAV